MIDPRRAAIGTPGLPIPQGYVKAVLRLLVEGAERLRRKRIVQATWEEDPITYHLNLEMEEAHRAGLCNFLSWEMQAATQYDPTDPLKTGEPDFKFRWSAYPTNDQRLYLGVEAKRLRGSGDSLATRYVDLGLMRFVAQKYGRGHDHGVMLGYVVVPPLDKAVASVAEAIARRAAEARVAEGLSPNASLCSYPHTHHSRHRQDLGDRSITLVHVFIDFT